MRSRAEMDVEATWRLVGAAAGGDPAARDEFCRHFAPQVRTWLRHRWSHAPFHGFVDDAVQETLLECLRPRGALARCDRERATHGFGAFLRSVAEHVAARIERRQARDYRHQRRLEVARGRATRPQLAAPAQIDRRWLAGRMQAAMAQCDRRGKATPHSAHELLRLLFLDGLTVREIAARWHQRAEQVHELRRRALRRLRRCLVRMLGAGGTTGEADLGRHLFALLA